jgi:hypothetical protein
MRVTPLKTRMKRHSVQTPLAESHFSPAVSQFWLSESKNLFPESKNFFPDCKKNFPICKKFFPVWKIGLFRAKNWPKKEPPGGAGGRLSGGGNRNNHWSRRFSGQKAGGLRRALMEL